MAIQTLHESIKTILERIQELLENKTVPGELLEEVNKVTLADRTREKRDLPSLVILPGTANNTHQRGAIREEWTLPVVIVSIVHSTKENEGKYKASELTAKARSVLIKDRRLGLKGIVHDVSSDMYEPMPDWDADKKRTLYYSMVTLNITFNVCEY